MQSCWPNPANSWILQKIKQPYLLPKVQQSNFQNQDYHGVLRILHSATFILLYCRWETEQANQMVAVEEEEEEEEGHCFV